MTLAEVYQQAKQLSPSERKELAKLLIDSLELPDEKAWTGERLLELMDAASSQFKDEYAHLNDEEQQALINQWIDEADAER